MQFFVVLLSLLPCLAQADVGFHFFNEPNLPAPIAAADTQNSVFQLVVPGVAEGGQPKEFLIDGMSDAQLATFAHNLAADRWRPDIREPALLAQFQLCRSRNLSNCPLFDGLALSSAFLLRDPHLIVATFHGVKSCVENTKALMGYKDEKQMTGMVLPFTLLNSQGEIVRGALPGLRVIALDQRLEDGSGEDVSIFSADGIALTGMPFLATQAVLPTDDVYAVGFPSATTTRAALGKQDASRDTLAWTQGKFTGASALLHTELENAMYGYDTNDLLRNPFFVSNNDGEGGMSGGPVLNQSGNVIGLVTEGLFRNAGSPPDALITSSLFKVLQGLNTN